MLTHIGRMVLLRNQTRNHKKVRYYSSEGFLNTVLVKHNETLLSARTEKWSLLFVL